MKCQKCGKKLRRNEVFCTICGYYNDFSDEKKIVNFDDEDDFDLTDDDWSSKEDDKAEEKELDKILKEKKPKKSDDDEDDYELTDLDRYVKAYIGEDYNIVRKSLFNIWALIFNWMYFLYRKLYITGIIGLVITYFVVIFLRNYAWIYFIIVSILSAIPTI